VRLKVPSGQLFVLARNGHLFALFLHKSRPTPWQWYLSATNKYANAHGQLLRAPVVSMSDFLRYLAHRGLQEAVNDVSQGYERQDGQNR